jgi:hypothetical protein
MVLLVMIHWWHSVFSILEQLESHVMSLTHRQQKGTCAQEPKREKKDVLTCLIVARCASLCSQVRCRGRSR